MTNQETSTENFFSTTLSSTISDTDLTIPVASIGSLTSPCFIIIDPDTPAKREVILADGTFGASSFVCTDVSKRGLAGSASGAQSHTSGTAVTVAPLMQHLIDIHDRVEAHTHTGGTDGTAVSHGSLADNTADDHTHYILENGTRAFSGTVSGVTPTAAAHLATKGYVDGAIPPGLITMYGAAAAPTGWLLCNGAAVSRTTYSALFAIIGTTFGAGDGSTTFNVPDMRDRFPTGTGSTYSLNDSGGSASVTLTSSQMPSHTHTGPSHTHTVDPPNTTTSGDTHSHGAGSFQAANYAKLVSDVSVGGSAERHRSTGANLDINITGTSATDNHDHTVNIAAFSSAAAGTGATGSAGSGSSHENRPPYLGVAFIIKT